MPAPTLDEIRGYAFPDTVVASSTGPQFAWVVDDHGRRNVWVTTAPGFQLRQLTAYTEDDGQEITSLAVSADGGRVVYVRGGAHGSNWDHRLPTNPLSQPSGTKVEIWSVPFQGGTPQWLAEGDKPALSPDSRRVAFINDKAAWIVPIDAASPAKPLMIVRGTIDSPTWSPDGRRLAFVASRESHALIGIYTDERTPILWLAPSTSRDGSPCWSPDGKRIAFARQPGDGGAPPPALTYQPEPWAIWVADAATGVGQQWWASGQALRDSYNEAYLEWGTGGRILFKSYRDGWQHLYSLSAAGADPLRLTPGDYMVEDVALSPDRKYLVFNANTGADVDDIDRRHLFKVSVTEGNVQPLTTGAGLEWSPAIAGDNSLLFISATAQRPPLVATQAARGGSVRLLAPESLAAFPAKEMLTPKRVSFRSADGVLVHGQLFEPKAGSGKHPGVVYAHGGPPRQMYLGWHPRAYYSNDYALNQYLASRGYVVLAVNYRLGIGYGHAFQYPSHAGSRGGAEYQDIQAAGRYLQSLAAIDPKRIGLYGGSYGGYLTAMGLAHDSDLFAVGVDIHGVHDWSADEDSQSLLVRNRYEQTPDAEQALKTAWESSPVAAVSTWKSPVLFIHGDDDRNVRFSQTVDLVRRLEKTGVHEETLVLVDEIHSIQLYTNELRMDHATADFLDRYLRAAN
jgi:dipeptidyl aminopeptidase/acylaminoacyl peptidase